MVKLFTKANTKSNKEILTDFSPLKTGWYLMKLVKDEWKKNKNGTGKYVAMQFKIVGSEYDGRIVYANANLKHKEKNVVEIANKFINTLSAACGKKNVGETEPLFNIIILGFIVEKTATKTQPPGNDIKNFKKATKKDILDQKKKDKKRLEEPEDEIEDDDDDDIFEEDETEEEDNDDDDIFEDDDDEELEEEESNDEEEEEEKEKPKKKKVKPKPKKKTVKSKKKKDDDDDDFPDY